MYNKFDKVRITVVI